MNIVLKGRIIPTQNTVGNVLTVPKSVDGNINSQKQIGGIVSTQTQRLSGIIKNPSHVHGIINKPSGQGKNDHVFVIVDLIKFHEQQLIVNSGIGLAFPSTIVSVNSMTANNIAFSNGNIIVNKEVLSNATA